MRNWEVALDNWLTTPPEPADVEVAKCAQCNAELYAGEPALYDSVDGDYYCDTDCFLDRMTFAGNISMETLEPPSDDDY